MNKPLSLFGAAVVSSIVLFATPVLASSYEWLTSVSGSCFWTCTPGATVNTQWTVNTSSGYNEYRSIYYVITPSSTTQTPDDSAAWTKVTSCYHNGLVNTSATDTCAFAVPGYGGSAGGSYWLDLRATTNYEGCGTWTPTPNVATCGDTRQTRVYVSAP